MKQLLLLRAAGIILPIYVMVRAVIAIHRRRHQQAGVYYPFKTTLFFYSVFLIKKPEIKPLFGKTCDYAKRCLSESDKPIQVIIY